MQIPVEYLKSGAALVQNQSVAQDVKAQKSGETDNARTDQKVLMPIEKISEAVTDAGLKTTPENMAMVKLLLQNDMPADKENLLKLYQAVKLLGPENMEKSLFLLQNGLKPNAENVRKLDALINHTTNISKQLSEILENVNKISDPELKQKVISLLMGNEDQKEALKNTYTNAGLNSKNDVFAKNQKLTSEEVSGQQIKEAPPKETLSKELAAKETVFKEAITKEALSKETITKEPVLKDFAPKEITIKDAASKELASKESISKEVATKETISKEVVSKELATKESISKDVMSKELAAKDSLSKDHITKDSILREFASKGTILKDSLAGEIAAREPSQAERLVKELLAQKGQEATGKAMLEKTADGRVPEEKVPAEHLQKQAAELKDATQQSSKTLPFHLKIDKDATLKEAEVFLNSLSERIVKAKELLARSDDPAAKEASKAAENVRENIEFASEIKNQMYLQIPIHLNNKETNSELFVFRDKHKRKKAGGVSSALISLDLAYLGHFESYVQKDKNKVYCQFRLEDERVSQLIRKNLPTLESMLKQKGYSLNQVSFKINNEPFSVIDKEPKEELKKASVDNIAFDVRT